MTRFIRAVSVLLAVLTVGLLCRKPSTGSPPDAPAAPAGVEQGWCGVSYEFSATTTDPDGDSIAIRFSWGDGDTSDWSDPVGSGDTVFQFHTWSAAGDFEVSAQARDKPGLESDWSGHLTADIGLNQAPGTPAQPSGPSLTYLDSICTFMSWAVDPDSDSVSIRFSWGDGDTSDWSEFAPSGQWIHVDHIWAHAGEYGLRAQATDRGGMASGWSDSLLVDVTRLRWRFRTGGWFEFSPAVGPDGTIYTAARDSGLYAVSPGGELRWRHPMSGLVQSSPAVAADGTVYVGCDDCLYAINGDGTLRWRFQTHGRVESSPAIAADGTVYVGSDDCYLYAINPDSTLKWRYQTGGSIYYSSPAIAADGTVYVGSDDFYLYAINPNGTLRWRHQAGGWVDVSPAVGADGTIYAGSSMDNYLHAISPHGALLWRYWGHAPVALADDGTIYIPGYLLDAVNPDGTRKWRYSDGYPYACAPPAVAADGTVYVASEDSCLYAISQDGTLKWRCRTGGSIYYSSPAIGADGTVYVGADDGYLYAIHGDSPLATSAWPRFHHDNRNTGRAGGGLGAGADRW